MERDKLAMILVIALMAVAIVATVLVNIAEYNESKPTPPDNLTIGVCAEHGYEPLFISSEHSYFSVRNVNITIIKKDSESAVMDSLVKGEIDIGAFGTSQFLHMVDGYGDKYKLIGRFSFDYGTYGATTADGKYANFKFDGKTSLIGAGIGVDLDSEYAAAALRYLDATGELQNYVIHETAETHDPTKVNIYDVKDDEICSRLTEGGNVDIVVGGAAVVDVVENHTGFKYIEYDYNYEFIIPVSLYASSEIYLDHSESVTDIMYALFDACSDILCEDGSVPKEEAVKICRKNCRSTMPWPAST